MPAPHPPPAEPAARPRLLVVASTFPATPGDATPAFVRDLAVQEAVEFDTMVLVPRVPAAAREERGDGLTVRRFRYFPRRWEDLADGAILENLRSRPSRWLQVVPFLVAETWALRRAVRRHRPDVLHLHWILPQGLAALIAARRVPWLVTTHGADVYAMRGRVTRVLARAVLRRAGAVSVVNADIARRVEELGGPTDPPVLPMGVDIDALRAAAAGAEQVPGRLLFVGRLVEKKGVAVLLDAVRRLPRDGWSLEVIGDGPLRSELQRRAHGLPVSFRGALPRDQVAAAFGRAQIVVVPSVRAASGDQDGLPVVLVEAMAVGRAVVASRAPGIETAVVDGQSGLLTAPNDPAALAAAIGTLLSDADRRTALGAAARIHADRFSVVAAGRSYRKLLGKLNPPPPPPPPPPPAPSPRRGR
jgi:colanic acid/amylovoran biosynthesis glycosyltransferase